MSDRRKQIELLIATRFDNLWFPTGSLRTMSGVAPGDWVTCGRCQGLGVVRSGKRLEAPCPDCSHVCERCGGTGFDIERDKPCATCRTSGDVSIGRVWAKGHKGERHVDTYTGERVSSSEIRVEARPTKTVRCDSCGDQGAYGNGERCPHCDGVGHRPLHRFDLQLDTGGSDDADPIDRAIDRRDQSGSYHELELALAGIVHHVNKPVRFMALTVDGLLALKLLDEVYLPPVTPLEEMTPWRQSLVDLALAYIDSRMPETIRVPGDVRLNERELRDRRTRARGKGGPLKIRDSEIRRLARSHGPQWIAAEYGLSVSQVYRIVNGQTEEAA